MASADLLLDAGFIGTMGVAYLAVGVRLARRHATGGGHRLALAMFSVWWSGVAGLFLLNALSGVLHLVGIDDPPAHFALTVLSMLSVCAGLWGLLYYVTYLFSGRSAVFLPFLAYYVADFAVLVYGAFADPTQAEAWRVSVSRLTILTGPIVTGAIVAFLVPVIVACAFYSSLFFRVDDPVQRYRVGMTSVAFLLWFGTAILATLLGVANETWWSWAGRIIGVLASGLVLRGYWPPRKVRERPHEHRSDPVTEAAP